MSAVLKYVFNNENAEELDLFDEFIKSEWGIDDSADTSDPQKWIPNKVKYNNDYYLDYLKGLFEKSHPNCDERDWERLIDCWRVFSDCAREDFESYCDEDVMEYWVDEARELLWRKWNLAGYNQTK